MAQRLVFADGRGAKSIDPADERFPEAWQWLSGAPQDERTEFYARVAAAYAAYNLTAETVSNIPFVLTNIKSGAEYDNSATWENKCGFLPNPSEIIRLAVLSILDTNTAYELKTTDALGYKVKGLYHLVPTTLSPVLDPVTGALREITRKVGMVTEHYAPDDRKLIRIWRLDHTTELLPSKNTDSRAMLSAAGIVYYADAWIEHFFRRGGIKPILIAMQGLVSTEKKDEAEKSWGNFIRGIGKWTTKVARIFNAEKINVTPFGSGVDDLKDAGIYTQALENIAIACRIPLSLLKANSANYATAREEKATWYENKLSPLCDWLAYEWNRQLWEPLDIHMDFKPETLDPQQEDETERAAAISTFMDFLGKCPNADIALATAETFGYELSDNLVTAIKAYFAEKERRREDVAAQIGNIGGSTSGASSTDGQDAQPGSDGGAGAGGDAGGASPALEQINRRRQRQAAQAATTAAGKSEELLFWQPNIDEVRELKVWSDVALRRLKRGESLDFDYRAHYTGLPDGVRSKIAEALVACKSAQDILDVFNASLLRSREQGYALIPGDEGFDLIPGGDISDLAKALNRVADGLSGVSS